MLKCGQYITTDLYDIPEGSLQLYAAFQTFDDRIQHAVRFGLNGLQLFGYEVSHGFTAAG